MKNRNPKGFGNSSSPEASEYNWDIRQQFEELRNVEVMQGPACPWPANPSDQFETERLEDEIVSVKFYQVPVKPRKKQSFGDIIGNLGKSVKQAANDGWVNEEIRSERLKTCEACPSFRSETRQCRECGCFMDVKAKIGGDPSNLCPLDKWIR